MEMPSSDTNSGMMDTSPGGQDQQYPASGADFNHRSEGEEGQLGDKSDKSSKQDELNPRDKMDTDESVPKETSKGSSVPGAGYQASNDESTDDRTAQGYGAGNEVGG